MNTNVAGRRRDVQTRALNQIHVALVFAPVCGLTPKAFAS
jgi:hypothetical protein